MNLNEKLQSKYPHLELAVLKLSEVQRDNESKRMDAEYFKKEYLENEQMLLPISVRLETIMLSGYYGILPKSDDYLDKGLSLIRGRDVRDSSLEVSHLIKVPYAYFQSRYEIHRNDILFLVKGATIGYPDGVLFVAEEPTEPMIFNGSVFKLQVKDVIPAYLYVFMMTHYFTSQKLREVANNGIEYNSLPSIKNFLIPLLPLSFQKEIESLVKDSHLALEQSKALYKEAEVLLYESLGLNPNNPLESILNPAMTNSYPTNSHFANSHSAEHSRVSKSAESAMHDKALCSFSNTKHHKNTKNTTNYTIKTLKGSFFKTGRLDAEYYQSKYELIEKAIKAYKNGCVKLKISEIKDSNFTPKATQNYRYIELANIGSNGNISTPTQALGAELPSRARRRVKEGDVIISSIEGSLSSCALITKEFDNCLVSTGFYVLNAQNINAETLLVLFKCAFFQEYLKKFPSGTILAAISKDELQNIFIPQIDFTIQESIAVHIQKSFSLRAEARKLLNEAKAQVESAIAQSSRNATGGGG